MNYLGKKKEFSFCFFDSVIITQWFHRQFKSKRKNCFPFLEMNPSLKCKR